MNPMDENIDGEIRSIVQEEITYLRHYIGEIINNNDPLQKGRLSVLIYELGFITPDLAIWCSPRQGNRMSIPNIGQWVEVYFIEGDRGKPVYLPLASEIEGNTPKNYTGDITKDVIYESYLNKANNIKFDNKTQLLSMLDGTESFVLGDKFLTWLQNFITSTFNAHTHLYAPGPGSPVASGVPVPTGASPTDILSLNIKGK